MKHLIARYAIEEGGTARVLGKLPGEDCRRFDAS
jgi:hypothetical protein